MLKRTAVAGAAAWVASSLVLYAGGALAQDTQRVEITGSSIKRIDAETALPVTVLKTEDLRRQGVTTAEQAIQRIAANQSNFGISQQVGATTGGKAEADLRGLSGPTGTNANKTLVLLNGRRIANHAFDAAAVDLNAIPLAAVDRIEVLRDGASALYGTDAIGGVINFILRRDYTGIELSAQTQQPEESGGGDTNRASIVAGWGSLSENRFNVMATLDWRKQKVLEAKDRSFAATGILHGDVVSGTSGTSFPGDLGGFEPSLPNCAPPGSIPNPAGTSCRYDFTRDIDIIPENEQITGLIRGSFAITPNHTVSVEYLRAQSESVARVAAAPTSHIMPATSPFFPAGAPISTTPTITLGDGTVIGGVPGGVANWRQVPAGKRTSGNETVTERAMLEFQGDFSGWDYRVAGGRSENQSDERVIKGYVNDDLMQLGVWNGLINPFGAQTPAGQGAIDAAQVAEPTVSGTNKVDFFDVRVTKDLFQMAAGPVSAAFGYEHRSEESFFENKPITGVLGSLGIDPDGDTSGGRDVNALFAEVNVPLMKGLDLTLAARYDKYSDFGDTFNPKISMRWQPMQQLLVRGSYNTGFRAPTLYEIYQPQSLTFTSDNYDDPVLCPGGVAVPGASAGVVCGQQVLQRLGGPGGLGQPIGNLQPEESKTWTVGLVFDPTPQITVGVDFFDMKIENLISGLAEQAIFGDAAKYAGKFVRCSALPAGPGPGIDRQDVDACLNFPGFDPIAYIDTPTENLGEQKVRGIDVNLTFRSGPTSWGNFMFNIDGTYIDKYEYQREKGGAFIDAVGIYADAAPVFRWQHVASVNWSQGPWAATLAQRYKSGYTDQDPAFEVGSYSIVDVSLTWTGVKGLSLTAGVNNLFDQDPPSTVQVTTFQRGYDPRFTDPLGRTYMFLASYKFF